MITSLLHAFRCNDATALRGALGEHHKIRHPGNVGFHLPPVHNRIQHSMLQQKLSALEAFRELRYSFDEKPGDSVNILVPPT